MHEVTLADVYRARKVVGRHLAPTPLLPAPRLSRRTGCDVYVKFENMSPIRSFKARGAINCVGLLAPGRGVACASTGNHGQGMALAAGIFGRRAVVVVPHSTPEGKQTAMRHFGADLRVEGADLAESVVIAQRIAAEENLAYIEDGEQPDVMAGCATLALEIVEQLPDVARLLVPAGGGNLLAACALVTKTLCPEARVIGVQSDAAPAVHDSWRAGESLRLDRCDTFAGGLATAYPCSYTFPYIQRHVDDVVLVPDAALIDAALVMLAETGHLPEGAGAAGLAALLAEPARYAEGKTVIVLTGGNFEPVIWERLAH